MYVCLPAIRARIVVTAEIVKYYIHKTRRQGVSILVSEYLFISLLLLDIVIDRWKILEAHYRLNL